MDKNRLEAFSDGVIAIIITIMVLELKVPHGSSWEGSRPLLPVFSSYVLSFVFVGIYWNNHHHTLKIAERVSGRVLWANLHLLFWMSLIPFVSGWMGENQFATLPVAIYGGIMLMTAAGYTLLVYSLISLQGTDSRLASAISSDGNIKGRAFTGAVPVRHSAGLLERQCSGFVVCGGGRNVVHSRPPHREAAG